MRRMLDVLSLFSEPCLKIALNRQRTSWKFRETLRKWRIRKVLRIIEFTSGNLVLDSGFEFCAVGDVPRRRVEFDALATPNVAIIKINLYRRLTSDANP